MAHLSLAAVPSAAATSACARLVLGDVITSPPLCHMRRRSSPNRTEVAAGRLNTALNLTDQGGKRRSRPGNPYRPCALAGCMKRGLSDTICRQLVTDGQGAPPGVPSIPRAPEVTKEMTRWRDRCGRWTAQL